LLVSSKGAPVLGEDNEWINKQFGLNKELHPAVKN
jgi:hypothetical protein